MDESDDTWQTDEEQRDEPKGKRYQCQFCLKRFIQSRSLRDHKAIEHDGKPRTRFHCEICDREFKCWSMFHYHQRTHSDETLFQCKTCGQKFKQNQVLQTHIKFVHLHQNRASCEQCGKTYNHKKDLLVHIRRDHIGDKPFRCQFCLMTFATKKHKQFHEKLHEGNKAFHCYFCESSFLT